jgi:hypothetical protein
MSDTENEIICDCFFCERGLYRYGCHCITCTLNITNSKIQECIGYRNSNDDDDDDDDELYESTCNGDIFYCKKCGYNYNATDSDITNKIEMKILFETLNNHECDNDKEDIYFCCIDCQKYCSYILK